MSPADEDSVEAVGYLPLDRATGDSLNVIRLGAAALDGFCSTYRIWLLTVQGDLKDVQPVFPLPIFFPQDISPLRSPK